MISDVLVGAIKHGRRIGARRVLDLAAPAQPSVALALAVGRRRCCELLQEFCSSDAAPPPWQQAAGGVFFVRFSGQLRQWVVVCSSLVVGLVRDAGGRAPLQFVSVCSVAVSLQTGGLSSCGARSRGAAVESHTGLAIDEN